MQERLIKIKTSVNTHVALWSFFNDKIPKRGNIFLTHGTFSSRTVLNGITEYLVENGFKCWVLEWRDHGASSSLQEDYNFETIAKQDIKLAFRYLFEIEGIVNMHCVTHSGGGICLTMALINNPEFKKKILSITLFAGQAFGAADSKLNYTRIFFGKQLSRIYGKVPAMKIGGEKNESYYFMKQWFNWNLTAEFKGEQGFDYKSKMKQIKTPIYGISGSGDTFIAPTTGCQLFVSSFENPANKYLLCSKHSGFAEDYNHSRILHSRNARKEIFPLVLDWINQHAAYAN